MIIKKVKYLTYEQWLRRNCSLSEVQIREYLIEDGWTKDDVEDYIEGKRQDYRNYLENISQ